jgi:hypothetical protein
MIVSAFDEDFTVSVDFRLEIADHNILYLI